jgi:hypothetical protein
MGILSALFGGGKSTSGNQAFGQLSTALTPAISTGVNALNTLGDELKGGFDAFREKAGYSAALDRILSGVTGNRAARGLLRSGSTGDEYVRRAGEYDAGLYDNYLNKVSGLGGLGLSAAGTLAGAGSTSTSKNQGGIVPGIASLFSDRRLKESIRAVGKLDNGLTVYAYNYIDGGPTMLGLMADEVEALHPEAVSEAQTFFSEGSYKTVDYDKAVM